MFLLCEIWFSLYGLQKSKDGLDASLNKHLFISGVNLKNAQQCW